MSCFAGQRSNATHKGAANAQNMNMHGRRFYGAALVDLASPWATGQTSTNPGKILRSTLLLPQGNNQALYLVLDPSYAPPR
jgi:hypothetical protein